MQLGGEGVRGGVLLRAVAGEGFGEDVPSVKAAHDQIGAAIVLLQIDAPGFACAEPLGLHLAGAVAPGFHAQAQAQRLTRICPRVLITGVAAGRGIACVGADRATGESLVRTPMVPKSFHGTGDIFGAVLVGRLLQGNVLPAAAQAAAVFVADCLKATPDEADERLGVWLESVLPRLMQNPE